MPDTVATIVLAEMGDTISPAHRAMLSAHFTLLPVTTILEAGAAMARLRSGAIVLAGDSAALPTLRNQIVTLGIVTPIIVLAGRPTVREAATVMRQGAVDYLSLRTRPAVVLAALQRALATNALPSDAVALSRAYQQARELLRDKNDFISLVSHELRTPLMAVNGYLELIRKHLDTLPQAKVKDYLTHSLAATGELAALADLLVQVLQLEAGQQIVMVEALDLAPVAMSVIEQCALLVARQRITTTIAPGVRVRADTTALQHILRNLLTNAIKYSPNGGPIEIAACQAGRATVEITVRDHGIGIAPEQLPQLFTRFARVHDRVRWPDIRGTGLGLYICQQLVATLGGRIWAESVVDEGSVFHVTLPAAPARTTVRRRTTVPRTPTAPARKTHAAKAATV